MVNEADPTSVADPKDQRSGSTSTFDEKRTSDEKVIMIRLERLRNDDDDDDDDDDDREEAQAFSDVLCAILHRNDKVKLISIDETEETKSLDRFSDGETWKKYLYGLEVPMSSKGNRDVFVFKLKTTMTFREVKYMKSTMKALTKWNISMNHHRLNFRHGDAHLIFNLFMIHPLFVNKTILARQIHTILKKYVHNATMNEKVNLGLDFCLWLQCTKDAVVEIGLRNWRANGIDGVVSTEVLTMRVDGQYIHPMKELVHRIRWNERLVGTMIEENPTLNNTSWRIKLVHRHNQHICDTAYVHVSGMPERMWHIRLPDDTEHTIQESLFHATTIANVDGTTEQQLFRSIHKITESTGLYYLITTKDLLHEAETFAMELMAKVNMTKEFKDDSSLVNPEKHGIVVGRKADRNKALRRRQDSTKRFGHKKYASSANRGRHITQELCTNSTNTTKISDKSTITESNTIGTKETNISNNGDVTMSETDHTKKTNLQRICQETATIASMPNAEKPVKTPDVMRRIEVLEEAMEALKLQVAVIVKTMEAQEGNTTVTEEMKAPLQTALVEENGLTTPPTTGSDSIAIPDTASTVLKVIEKKIKRVKWNGDPSDTFLIDMDADSIRARGSIHKRRDHYPRSSKIDW